MNERNEIDAGASEYRPDKQLMLQAKIAEYGQLRSEIAQRSDFQNRGLQLHITVIGFTVAAVASGHVSYWVLLVIPLESVIFLLYFMDHALTIEDLGRYLTIDVEQRINREILSVPGYMDWETGYRAQGKYVRRAFGWDRVVFWSYLIPSGISVVVLAVDLGLHIYHDKGYFSDSLEWTDWGPRPLLLLLCILAIAWSHRVWLGWRESVEPRGVVVDDVAIMRIIGYVLDPQTNEPRNDTEFGRSLVNVIGYDEFAATLSKHVRTLSAGTVTITPGRPNNRSDAGARIRDPNRKQYNVSGSYASGIRQYEIKGVPYTDLGRDDRSIGEDRVIIVIKYTSRMGVIETIRMFGEPRRTF